MWGWGPFPEAAWKAPVNATCPGVLSPSCLLSLRRAASCACCPQDQHLGRAWTLEKQQEVEAWDGPGILRSLGGDRCVG